MKVTEITYSRGQTLQLRQFEPVNIHISAKAEVVEGENINNAYLDLQKIVDEEVALKMTVLEGSGKLIRETAKAISKSVPF